MDSVKHARLGLLTTGLAAVLLIAAPSPAFGQVTWDATPGSTGPQDGSGTWSTADSNWWNGTTNVVWPNLTSSTATFGAGSGAAGTVTVSGSVTANRITFAAPGSGNYTLSGGTIGLAGTTPTIDFAAAASATIGSVISGTSGLRVGTTGAGGSAATLTLTGANNYSGGTVMVAGVATTVILSGQTASLGSGTFAANNYNTTLASGGALNGSRTIASGYTRGSGGNLFGTTNFTDRIVIDGTFNNGTSDGTIDTNNAVLTINGPVVGAGGGTHGIRFNPNGVFGRAILNGNNSGYSGRVTLSNAGTLVAGNANALGTGGSIRLIGGTLEWGPGVTTDFSSRFNHTDSTGYLFNTGGNNVTFNTAITPSTVTRAFMKAGDGTLTLNSATASTFTGTTTLRGGTLELDFANIATPTNLLASNPVDFAGGTLAVKGKAGAVATTQTFGLMNLSTADSAITVNNNGGPGTTLNFSTLTRSTWTTLDVDISQGGIVNNAGFTADTTMRYMTVKDATASGIGRVDASKNLVRLTGQTTLTAASNASGTDWITSGSLTMNSGTKALNTLTLDATSASGSLDIGTGSFRGATGSAIALIGNNNYTVSNGSIGATGETIVHTLGSGTLTLAANASFDTSSATQLVKNGPGTLQILGAQGANLGDVYIGQGTVAIGNNTSLGGSGSVRIVGDSTLRADAAGLTITKSFSLPGETNSNQMRTLTLEAAAGNSMTLNGVIQSHGRLIKTGAGTVTLGNSNTYSGGTRLDAGTLSISDSRNLGNRNYNQTVFNGGTLQITGTTLTNLDTNFINWDSFNGGLDIANAANVFSVNSSVAGTGSLTKSGSGVLVLSASNGFSGATTISGGILSIASADRLQGTSGVSIANAARLRYTGGAGNFARNISVTSGTGTVENTGGALLTLSGTLAKDGTVLRLTGGQFNVTGQIVGASANSDLLVDGTSTVTLSAVNSYNGPTFVNQASTLIVGINDAIPSNSTVTLGDAATRGTLDLGGFTNAIGGLVFSGSGGTVRMAANQTSAAQLSSASGLALGSNASLDLTGMQTSAGNYRLISSTGITGTFGNVTGLNSNYLLRYGTVNANEVSAQRKADQATTFTMTTGNVTRALVNTNVAVSGTLINSSTFTGGSSLAINLASTGLSGSGFSTGSIGVSGTTAVSGLLNAGSAVGAQNWSITNTDINAITGTSTVSGSLQVVNQRSFSVSNSGTINLGNFLRTAAVTGSATISSSGLNATTANATLGLFGGGPSGFSLATNDSTAFNGGSATQEAVYTLSGSAASAGVTNGSFTSTVSAELGSIDPVSVALVGTAYDPATAVLASGGSAVGNAWTINLGEFNQGAGTSTPWNFAISNLLASNLYTADLVLESFSPTQNSGAIFMDLTGTSSFPTLAASGTNPFTAWMSLTNTGTFTNTYNLTFASAKDGQSLGGSQNVTLTLTGVIIVPEPGSLALAGIGIAAAAYALRRRK